MQGGPIPPAPAIPALAPGSSLSTPPPPPTPEELDEARYSTADETDEYIPPDQIENLKNVSKGLDPKVKDNSSARTDHAIAALEGISNEAKKKKKKAKKRKILHIKTLQDPPEKKKRAGGLKRKEKPVELKNPRKYLRAF